MCVYVCVCICVCVCVCVCVCMVCPCQWVDFTSSLPVSVTLSYYREEEAALRESLAEIFADPDGEDEDELKIDLQDKNERYSAKDPMKPFSL